MDMPTPRYRSVPDSVVIRMKRDQAFDYANNPRYWDQADATHPPPGPSKGWLDLLFGAGWVRNLMYVLLALAILFIVYRVVVNQQLFYSRGAPRSREKASAPDRLSLEDIDRLLQEALDLRDLRNAVRYRYLRTLFEMDRKGWIHYHPEATNQDYLHQIRGKVAHADFSYLTRAYEFIWYGGFDPTAEQFGSLENRFRDFQKRLQA